jgi:hypothetical protein
MCQQCSRIRCDLYAIVSGKETEFSESCGTYCFDHNGDNLKLGATWKTLPGYVGKLIVVLAKRIVGRV